MPPEAEKKKPEATLRTDAALNVLELEVLGSIARRMQTLAAEVRGDADLTLGDLQVTDSNGDTIAVIRIEY